MKIIIKKIREFRKKKRFRSFYNTFINKGDLCFDIGANYGQRSDVFLSLGARVIAVEPVLETYQYLQKKYKACNSINILNCAVGSINKDAEIYISNHSQVCTLSKEFINQYSRQKNIDIYWFKKQKTHIITLDEIICKYGVPSFCKIDVEGFELEVLKGLNHEISCISFEYNQKLRDVAIDCVLLLAKNNNVSFNFSEGETMIFKFEEWVNYHKLLAFLDASKSAIQTGDIYVYKQEYF